MATNEEIIEAAKDVGSSWVVIQSFAATAAALYDPKAKAEQAEWEQKYEEAVRKLLALVGRG
jgi:predicted RNA-binding protein with PUA-like domain